jgi:Xaa-Pro aminopeptidase
MLFAEAEYRTRCERAQQAMHREGIDALLLTMHGNFDYFAGFDINQPWTSATRSLMLLLPSEGDPSLILPAFLAPDAPAETWIADVRTYSRVDRADVELLVDLFRERGLERGRVGLELGQEQRINLAPRDLEQLRESLPHAEIMDAAPLLWGLRLIKSPAELAEIRRGCRATDAALVAALSGAREGWSELEVSRLAQTTALQSGADWLGFVCVTSGPGSYHRHLGRPRARQLERGDMLWMDLGIRASGYWTDYCRAGVVGGPSPEQQATQAAIRQATLAGIGAIRPGVPVSEVARTTLEKCDEIGLPVIRFGRVGHGMGLGMTEPPHVALFDSTVLQPGMVITVEPAVFDDSGIYCIEEMVAVTEDGHEVLSGAPRELATI